ncbi:MAG: DMT family transporter [Clostridia bacterium]|jgi:drug/metabolite transporter (DMT)-like permease|nr:DMT family transporter [Clostridia bacterium]
MTSTKSNIFLLICAAIWGFAFVAQRVGMEYVGPFTYNGIRFALGSISLLPLIFYSGRNGKKKETRIPTKNEYLQVGIIGLVLFIAASLQQIGLIYTEAGKAAFITGLYVVMVPVVGILLLKHEVSKNTLLGAAAAAVGLYLLSVKAGFTVGTGDIYVLIGAFFWTAHILLVDRLVKTFNALKLAQIQFIICSALSLLTALIFEEFNLPDIMLAAAPILYGGVFSVGVAYTLQILGQKGAHPSHAAIILSLETVFGAVGGYLLIDERLGGREYIGCLLMLMGMIISQYKRSPRVEPPMVEQYEPPEEKNSL